MKTSNTIWIIGAVLFWSAVFLLPRPFGGLIYVIAPIPVLLYFMVQYYYKQEGLKAAAVAGFSTIFYFVFWLIIAPAYCHHYR